MDSKDIFILVFVIIAVGASFYRKYVKKNQGIKPFVKQKNTGSSFSSVKDDYEPYSKK
jgi:uncharacterized protein YxeA